MPMMRMIALGWMYSMTLRVMGILAEASTENYRERGNVIPRKGDIQKEGRGLSYEDP
jgi:hypothetical protein